MKKRAIFFDPYLETVGGGERYVLTLVEHLLQKGWELVLVGEEKLKEKFVSRFNLGLEGLKFVSGVGSPLGRFRTFKGYDLFFWLSDGSIPWLFSKKNILHFQVPFHNVNGRSLQNQLKLKKISSVVCNSEFTKSFIDKEFGVNSIVVYPPVEVDLLRSGEKENLILAVGRFSQLLQAKRQDILIEVFKKMVDDGLTDWQLVLIGGADVGATEYLKALKEQSRNYPIRVLENLSFREVRDFYGKAKIFWNASGFGIDEEKEPERVEHFGMVVVEAMAADCVPVVVGKGGIKEIVKEGETGLFWETKEDLIQKTLLLIKSPAMIKKISQKVAKSSQEYSKEKFCQEFEKLL